MKRPSAASLRATWTTEVVVSAIALAAIGLHLVLRFGAAARSVVLGFSWPEIPLLVALASGIPVLTSAVTGGSEVVRDGVNGAVTASLEPQAIARSLTAIRDSDARRLALAARASAEPFTYAAQVEGLERIFRLLGQQTALPAQ